MAETSASTGADREDLVEWVCARLAARTGLRSGGRQAARLGRLVEARVEGHGPGGPDAYRRLLEGGGEEAEEEWEFLARGLAVGESYFFRDRGQFDLLRRHLLPELLEKRRKERRLRLLSAGCATGEEAYSLAILLEPFLLGEDWRLHLVGLDADAKALERARRAEFGEWSFRGVDPGVRKTYFEPCAGGWRPRQAVRRRVVFEHFDLLAEPLPDYRRGLCDMDLILCRNVFIYFEPGAVARTMEKFEALLREGGLLLTAHADLGAQRAGKLRARRYPESVVYEKVPMAPVRSGGRPAPAAGPAEPVRLRADSGAAGQGAADQKEARQQVRQLCDRAREWADRGEYERGGACCREALAVNAFAAEPHFLLAQMAEEQGDETAAERHLKKVVYLEPEHVPAYLELGLLYERQRRRARAAKMRSTAAALLGRLPEDALVEPYGETAAMLLAALVEERKEGA